MSSVPSSAPPINPAQHRLTPIGEPPTIRKVGRLIVVSGDPRGPTAHQWCSEKKTKVFKADRHAQSLYEQLLAAYHRRKRAHEIGVGAEYLEHRAVKV